MPIFLSLLRGINVSGQKKILMKDLQSLYEELHFNNVRTYIQSGNVIFEASKAKNLAERISKKIFAQYKFSVPVLICTQEELQRVANTNPFLKEKNIDEEKLYVTFCAEEPQQELQDKLAEINFAHERYSIVGKNIFLYCSNGYGNAKLNNNFFEQKLGVQATTRNWKTVNELLKIMHK